MRGRPWALAEQASERCALTMVCSPRAQGPSYAAGSRGVRKKIGAVPRGGTALYKGCGMTGNEVREFFASCELLVVDMDGTCLNGARELTAGTLSALGAVIERGIPVVPATGRGLWEIEHEFLAGLPIRHFITANGALTSEAGGRRLRSRLIDRALAVEVVQAFMSADTLVYVHEDDARSTHLWGSGASAHEAFTIGFDTTRVKRGMPPLEEDLVRSVRAGTPCVHKVGVRFRAPWTAAQIQGTVAARFPQLVSARSEECLVEMNAAGANKGEALTDLCAHLGVPLARVCAIGDNGNDLSMVRAAGLGVAVANASEEVRAAADFVTAHDHDHEGVARFLTEYALG